MTIAPARRRRLGRATIAGAVVVAPVLLFVAPAAAHPLGNATVSHYDGLTLGPDHIDNFAVEDSAEIPTVARESSIDTDGNGTLSDAERATYAGTQCTSLATGVHVSVGTTALTWQVQSSDYSQRPGAASLPIGRLECRLHAAADLSVATTVSLEDNWDGAGIGWHEITAVADGVALTNSPVPAASISQALLVYPNDMLSSPLNVRSATLSVSPGGASTYTPQKAGAQANWAVRTISKLTTTLNDLVKGRLDLGVGLLAVLLSILLGAGHAMLPGHGKTIMAAYLVGKRGRLRDVVTVGATVTITHTAGVLVLGTLISLSATFAPTAVEQSLGVVSGLIVVVVGVGLLIAADKRRRAAAATVAQSLAVVREADGADVALPSFATAADNAVHPTHSLAVGGAGTMLTLTPVRHASGDHAHGDHAHNHHAHSDHAHSDHADSDHDHDHDHDHDQDGAGSDHKHGWLGGGHSHGPGGHTHTPEAGFSRRGLIGLGAAGGLVPSPSALLVLLATIALGRTAFGVVLVLAYGVGMAGALTLAGLLLVKFRNKLAAYGSGRFQRLGRLAAIMPIVTATLVIVVGVGLALRSLGGSI